VRDLLQEGHRLLPNRSLEIIDGVLRALDYSHQAGIVHRDIKPGNVMVTRNGDVKVMDFGIARAMSDAQATMTQTAQVIGTAQYLSPEQARGERVDSRSDLYSAGCLLYELLTGRPPFTGDSPVAIAYQHVRENPIPPSQVDPDVPGWADAIVLKAMAKSPADRYQTAADMRADLQRAASGLPVSAVAPTRADMYALTRRMGPDTMMGTGRTSQIPPVQDDEYAGAGYPRRARAGGGGRRWLPWVLGLVLVLAVVVAVAYYLLAGGKTTSVPLVDNETVSVAENQIKTADLVPALVYQPSSAVAKGLVIRANPPEGNNVAAKTVVTLYISTGAAPVAVPDVEGKQENAAQATLQSDGFQVKIQTDATSTEPSGTVVNQSPLGGTNVPPGSTVTIFVSGGVTVPNVVGVPGTSAMTELQNDGFKVDEITAAGPAGTAPGNVWQQHPSANTPVTAGSTVTIYIQPAASPSPSATPTPSPTASNGFGGGGF
jgi:eukaryotic-like serine/threonine-protein kinase